MSALVACAAAVGTTLKVALARAGGPPLRRSATPALAEWSAAGWRVQRAATRAEVVAGMRIG